MKKASHKEKQPQIHESEIRVMLKKKGDHTQGLGEAINGYLLLVYILCHNRLWFYTVNLLISDICGMRGDIYSRISSD